MTKPIETIRDGALSAAIWKNQGEKGAFYSVTFERVYTGEDNQPKNVSSFSGSDLLKIALLATDAYKLILALRSADKAGQ